MEFYHEYTLIMGYGENLLKSADESLFFFFFWSGISCEIQSFYGHPFVKHCKAFNRTCTMWRLLKAAELRAAVPKDVSYFKPFVVHDVSAPLGWNMHVLFRVIECSGLHHLPASIDSPSRVYRGDFKDKTASVNFNNKKAPLDCPVTSSVCVALRCYHCVSFGGDDPPPPIHSPSAFPSWRRVSLHSKGKNYENVHHRWSWYWSNF